MADFKILPSAAGGYVILSPKRAKRPDEAVGFKPMCPFCIGNEKSEKEVFRIGGKNHDDNWQVRVLENKFPFASIHEVIVHSPDHHKNFDELPLQQVQTVFEVFLQRYNAHQGKGTVFLFSNHGEQGGESLSHPHSQLVVLPEEVNFQVPVLTSGLAGEGKTDRVLSQDNIAHATEFFTLRCPQDSQWPDEVWIVPKMMNKSFGQIGENERSEISFILQRLIQLFTVKHGHEFPFNFYIYPKENWYLRFIPREKRLGGLEIVSNIFVNTGDPEETRRFIKEKFQ